MQARKSLYELPTKHYEKAEKLMQVLKTLFKPVKLYVSVKPMQVLKTLFKHKLYASVLNLIGVQNFWRVFKTLFKCKTFNASVKVHVW